MPELETVTIKNFQSLEDITLDFADLTVIEGPSDSGKSALFRAIRSAVVNQTGDAMLRHGSSEFFVTVSFEHDTIVWGRDGDGNYYATSSDLWRKMGGKVPPEISEKYNMGPVEFAGEFYWPNFVGQFDSPFLLATTGSRVAAVFGRLTSLFAFTGAISKIASSMREKKSRLTSKENFLKELREDVKAYLEVIDSFPNRVYKLRGLRSSIWELRDVYKRLVVWNGLRSHYGEVYDREQKAAKSYVSMNKNRMEFLEQKALVEKLHRFRVRREHLLTLIVGAEKRIEGMEEFLERVTYFGVLLSRTSTLGVLAKKRGLVLSQIEWASVHFDACVETVKDIEDTLDDLKVKLKICPLCGRKFNGVSVPVRGGHSCDGEISEVEEG